MKMYKLFLLSFLISMSAFSQPYYFYSTYHDPNVMGEFGYTTFTRINLQTGAADQYPPDTIRGDWSVHNWDPYQKWLFVNNDKDPMYIINCSDPSIKIRLPREIYLQWPRNVEFNPPFNRIYMAYVTTTDQQWHYLTLNTSDLSIIDTTKGFFGFRFYSKDGSILYRFVSDETSQDGGGSGWYEFVSATTKQMLKRKRIYDIGPPHEPKYLDDGKNGIGLLGFLYPKIDEVDELYLLYDPSIDSVLSLIHYPHNSKGYLSSDAKYTLLRKIQSDKNPPMDETGEFDIFESSTGRLRNRLWLPDGGTVLIYLPYPQYMYYCPPKEERAIIINLDDRITDNILIDSLRSETRIASINGWLGNNALYNELDNDLQTAENYLSNNDSSRCAQKMNSFCQKINDTYIDSLHSNNSRFVKREAWIALYYNGKYISERLPQTPPSGCTVKLVNSGGSILTTGALQYYEGSWKDAINNNDGTFTITTSAKTLSLRMTYEYGSQTKSNVPVGSDTVVFQTVNAQIKLQNSQGTPIDTGTVQYYAGAWRTLGSTTNGIAIKELLSGSYSFRMTYAYASKDKQQDIGANPTVIFQTVNAAVQLQNSLNSLIDQGTVQYYSGAWRDFGTTINGIANKELLPNNYSFRMTYAYASKDKQQDIGANPTVIFQTVNAAVQLQNSLGSLIDQGTVQYYSGAWRDFGTTINGVANKELLPNNYSFRMTYAFASKDKQQDISSNPTVVFQTINAKVQLLNSQGNLMDQGTVQYYSGAWRTLGTTVNGVASKELLPNSYSFRMTYEYVSNDKTQDLSTNNTVNFSTVLCTVRVKNSQNQPVDNALASYYSGAWRQIGSTVNGEVTKELLPANLSFRVKVGTVQQDKTQNLSTSSVVEFGLP